MSAGSGKWGDLGVRMASGLGMALAGLLAIWAGGWWFAALTILAGALMIWELASMQEPGRAGEARGLAVLAGIALLAAYLLPAPWRLLPLLLPILAAMATPRRDKTVFAAYGLAILVASHGLAAFRDAHGMLWLGWLVAVVVVTDIAGYFAGRLIGGPKFWPRVSPKKTWAGILAGWVAAALVGFAFRGFTTAGPALPWISMALSFASQLGDIAESAIKRRAGVKDSSALIPGHGGLMDRFDGLLGAALVMLFVALVVVVPVVRV